MLYRVEQVELLQLARLVQTRDGATLKAVLEAELKVSVKHLVASDDSQKTLKLQGRVKLLEELLDLLATAGTKVTPLS